MSSILVFLLLNSKKNALFSWCIYISIVSNLLPSRSNIGLNCFLLILTRLHFLLDPSKKKNMVLTYIGEIPTGAQIQHFFSESSESRIYNSVFAVGIASLLIWAVFLALRFLISQSQPKSEAVTARPSTPDIEKHKRVTREFGGKVSIILQRRTPVDS